MSNEVIGIDVSGNAVAVAYINSTINFRTPAPYGGVVGDVASYNGINFEITKIRYNSGLREYTVQGVKVSRPTSLAFGIEPDDAGKELAQWWEDRQRLNETNKPIVKKPAQPQAVKGERIMKLRP